MNNKWKLINTQYIEEVNSTLVEYKHIKSNATLLWMKNDDLNKLFSISFKTIPHDDTGVFHILEHSVLCGSKKYPVREPFVELIKSSMNTYLNAMTFPDKTVYPISSRNKQDYLNLMDVYLDAVFAPAIFTNPNIFYQEGWHYEFDNNNTSVNGVVYNEMKGAEASVDTIIDNELNRMLFNNHCYGYVSGGDTKSIPSLTYEMFIDEYKTYYHPSNSIIYVEGNIPEEETFAKIESYLDTFEASNKEIELPLQEVALANEKTCTYGISDDEEEKDRTQIVYGKIAGTFEEKNKMYAISLLTEYLAAYNTSPLKKALLDANICQDVVCALNDGIMQPYFVLQVFNTNIEDKDEIKDIIQNTIHTIIKNGIDKEELEGTLNLMEFSYRDPYEPKALIHNILSLNSGLYSNDYTLYLKYNETFKFLREMIQTDYYEELLEELFDFDYLQTLYMIPSKTYLQECIEDEKQRIYEHTKDWNEDTYKDIETQNEQLKTWQTTPDTEQQLNTIPKLSIYEVSDKPEKIEYEMINDSIIYYPSNVSGIVYFNYYFKIKDVKQEDLPYLNMLAKLYMNLPTNNKTLEELKKELKKYIGNLSFSLNVSALHKDDASIYLHVSCSCIEHNIDNAISLISEILLETKFDDIKEIQSNLVQTVEFMRNDIVESGNRYSVLDANSYYSKASNIRNHMHGYPAYQVLKDLNKNFEDKKEVFIKDMITYQDNMFFKNACILSVKSTNKDIDFNAFLNPYKLYDKDIFETNVEMKEVNKEHHVIKIPSDTSYSSLCSNLYSLGGKYEGAYRILAKIISYNYLWLEVRVKGGAYGTSCQIARRGDLSFTSYRDPSPANSVEVFKKSISWLKEFIDQEDTFDSFIISSIADIEPLLSPKQEVSRNDTDILNGVTYELLCDLRKEMLSFNKEDAYRCIKVLNNMINEHTSTIVTSAKTIDKLEGYKKL